MVAEVVSFNGISRPFRRDGLGYVWDIAAQDITIRADPIWERWHEVRAEIAISIRGKHLHRDNRNLSRAEDRLALAQRLANITNGAGISWDKYIEQFCVGVLEAARQSSDTQYTQAAEHKNHVTYLVDNLVMAGKTNMLFALGGSGKGMLTCAICVCLAARIGLGELSIAPASPFYFDWEDDFDTFEGRINSVARGLGVPVPRLPYRRMRGLAADRINEMARALSEAGSNFGVIDSFSAAGGTTLEGGGWDTIAHRLFDALDMIPDMTWLIIDHLAAPDSKRKSDNPIGKAFGSIQKMNRVRNAWEMHSEQEPGSDTVHMKLFDAKWNHTGKRRPMGMCMSFNDDGVVFRSEDPVITADGTPATISDKMMIELARGPLSTGMLAYELGTTDANIRKQLQRYPERFERQGDFIRLMEGLDD